ncbi:MCT family MFS transporter [Aspergillus saccharolyticus JOP 1030-1]|uniref:MFS general substrate transporter n=1 Tax=Aspergillus saccharolyticus JOP 1030-1 TaxID=1450539 RepID=A0A319A125_9EURO|nr:MFS general substrate transporter [Aspergillus saccharolyticus JOP 1030-1]PYH45998.1 MFS general substrate transporter [Aspergillus saccharolyticus JOP 1030-1]
MGLTKPHQTSQSDVEKTEPIVSADHAAAPDGGLQAWLVAGGSACIIFSCLGFANSFGVFEEYYAANQLRNESTSSIAWIGSVCTFLQFAAGGLGGPLFDRYGAWVIRPAAVVYIVAMMMTSLCSKYWQFMLAQGVLLGTAMAFLQLPAMAATAQYFDKKKAAALGLIISGSSIGGVVFPIALSKMLNSSSLGFGWSVRVMGFVIIPLMGFACMVVKPRLPPRTTSFFIPEAFTQARFDLIVAAFFFMFIGLFTPLFYLPTYAVTQGVDATLASYLLAILNAASTFGRIIPGILADKYGRMNMFALGGIATGVISLCMTKAQSTAGLAVYAVFIGFASGTIISGATAALTLCVKDARDSGTYLGMGIAASSVAALIGPPVIGALFDHYGGFLQASIFSGVLSLAGGCIAFAAKATTSGGLLGRV